MSEYTELYIDQGTDFNTIITIEDDDTNLPQNLTGYLVTSQIRKSLLSLNAYATFQCSVSDAVNGEITVSMTAANTANMAGGRYMFDIKTINTLVANTTERLIEGVIFVIPSITR